MEYGIPSLMEFSTVERHAAFCSENGYRFVELNMTYPWFQAEYLTVDLLQSVKKTYGIEFTLHLHDQVNPFELCNDLREASVRMVIQALEVASENGIRRITMHMMPGMYSAVAGVKKYIYEHCLNDYLEYAKRFRDLVSKYIGKDTILCVENTSGYHTYQKQAVELLLESPSFGLTYDVGHDAKIGWKDAEFVMNHSDRIRHFHIHDRNSGANHLAFGTGMLDLKKYLDLADKLQCTVLAEVKESESLIVTRKYLQDIGKW